MMDLSSVVDPCSFENVATVLMTIKLKRGSTRKLRLKKHLRDKAVHKITTSRFTSFCESHYGPRRGSGTKPHMSLEAASTFESSIINLIISINSSRHQHRWIDHPTAALSNRQTCETLLDFCRSPSRTMLPRILSDTSTLSMLAGSVMMRARRSTNKSELSGTSCTIS